MVEPVGDPEPETGQVSDRQAQDAEEEDAARQACARRRNAIGPRRQRERDERPRARVAPLVQVPDAKYHPRDGGEVEANQCPGGRSESFASAHFRQYCRSSA